MHRLTAILAVILLPRAALAADPAPDVKGTIERGLTFLAKDNLAWKVKRKCAECHHAPFTIWALNEGKKQGYAVDDKALSEMNSWVASKEYLAKLFTRGPKQEQIVLHEAPLLLALGIEAGNAKPTDGLKQMLASVMRDQDKDGAWRLGIETGLPIAGASTTSLLGTGFGHDSLIAASALITPGRVVSHRPIGPSPDTLTTLALLALSAPNAPDMGKQGKAVREKGLKWLRAAQSNDDELQATALRLVLWRRLSLPAAEWEPLAKKIRSRQNKDGGWGQTQLAKSDAYATGQALYALAQAGEKPTDEMVRKAQTFLAKTQRQDGSWAMASRAILPGSGTSSKNLEPITHAGSAWAVIGLARSSPAASKSGNTDPK